MHAKHVEQSPAPVEANKRQLTSHGIEGRVLKGYLHTHVQSSVIHDGHKVATIQASSDRLCWINNEIFNLKKEGESDAGCTQMDPVGIMLSATSQLQKE